MAEQPGKAIGLEGLYELQKDLPRNQNRAQGSKTNVFTTVRSVVDDQKSSGVGTAAWKEGDKEMIGKVISYLCTLTALLFNTS